MTVSVAIPVYNGERYVGEAIASVQGQTRAPDECLVLDNCSTDRTVEIAEAALGPAAVRTSEVNLGRGRQLQPRRRRGHRQWFAWLGADDRLAPRVHRAVHRGRARRARRRRVPARDPVHRPRRRRSSASSATPSSPAADARTRLRSFLNRPRWTEVYCLYRRDALLASPGFQPEYGADVLLTWWFLLRSPLVVLDEPLRRVPHLPRQDGGRDGRVAQPHGHQAPLADDRACGAACGAQRGERDGVDRRVARIGPRASWSAACGTASGSSTSSWDYYLRCRGPRPAAPRSALG